MKIQTKDLTGAALDWAVAKCEGFEVGVITREDLLSMQLDGETDIAKIARIKDLFSDAAPKPAFVFTDGWKSENNSALAALTGCGRMEFSTRWAQGGPIIEREGINLHRCNDEQTWFSVVGDTTVHAPTPLIAAMRCYVASRLGPEVDVPDDLTA